MLRAAADHHRAGRLDEAERGYAQVLAASPGNADALHLDGVIALQRGDAARAARQIASALARNPRLAGWPRRRRRSAALWTPTRASCRPVSPAPPCAVTWATLPEPRQMRRPC